jgi:hypothetical protein
MNGWLHQWEPTWLFLILAAELVASAYVAVLITWEVLNKKKKR